MRIVWPSSKKMDSPRRKEVRIQGLGTIRRARGTASCRWGAFEHFCRRRPATRATSVTAAFFKKFYSLLPDDGRMLLLHTIVVPTAEEGKELGLKTTMSLLRFISFHPQGDLPRR